MAERKIGFQPNGTTNLVKNKNTTAVRLWKKIQINEWTFSLFLFGVSLSIVLGKLCINYGHILQWQHNVKYAIPSISVFSNTPDSMAGITNIPHAFESNVKRFASTSEKFVNVTNRYEDIVASATSLCKTYGWLIRAAISGLVMMGFTWFIIYKDSSIPGVNPPSPFSPSKRRVPEASRVQMNYLVGALNGMLIFLYMCL